MHMVSFSIRARNTPAFSTRPGRLTLGGSGFCGSLTDGVHARQRNYLSFLLLLQCTYFPPGMSLYQDRWSCAAGAKQAEGRHRAPLLMRGRL